MQSLTFLSVVLLFVLVGLLRRGLERRRVNPGLRQFFEELGPPQRLLFLYLATRAAEYFWTPDLYPEAAKALETASRFFGIVGVLRLGDSLVFAFIHWRGRRGAPRILRTLAAWALTFLCAAVLLRHAYRFDLSSLFATSALLSVVLGFALQESLGNLFAGLTLNAEQPFEPGEWVTFGKYTGLVVDVGWRSTRLLTLDEDEILVPNGLISREVVINHMRPQITDAIELLICLDLDVSPARAKAVLREAVASCSRVLQPPAVEVEIASFAENGVNYRIKFHTEGFHLERKALDQVQEAIWYALRRGGIEMPYPQTTVSYRERAAEAELRRRREHLAEAEELLGRIDFVQALSAEARRVLAERTRFLDYGPGQAVVRQGESGETLYLVARGEVSVRVQLEGGEREVARLGRGSLFGEMSVLTGEPRTATVIALGDAALLAVNRDAFERILTAEPDLAERLAETIARRRTALEAVRAEQEAVPMETVTSTLLTRIRDIFGFQKRATGT
ncbi:MAG TPA: mechanosensitive ion channel family protein [Myxococcales bacterium]|nr:mechanosensitive ion channel family protein [Myxococcales bacterium]